VTEPRRARRNELPTAIMKYVGSRIGEDVYLDSMVQDLEFTGPQIRSAIYNMRSTNPTLASEIEVIVSGQIWRYRPRPFADQANGAQPASEQRDSDAPPAQPTPPAPARSARDDQRGPVNQPVSRTLYEEAGELNGAIIVRDEHNRYFQLTPLQLNIQT